jgi:hypothetical protein
VPAWAATCGARGPWTISKNSRRILTKNGEAGITKIMSRLCLVTAIVGLALGCSSSEAPQTAATNSDSAAGAAQSATTAGPTRLTSQYLPNLVQVHPRVLSGGLPKGERAFQELADRGVRTIISVDGAKPDVRAATKFGLRYVHLPHGYDGVPRERAQALAKAVRELDGPFYIHCHHGKHRSPAAASVACVATGLIPPSSALSVLELAGTSPHYQGLYRSAEDARPLADAVLDALQVTFQDTAEVPPMAEAMVALEITQDHLEGIADAGWKAPADHPDLEPAHEALLLKEHFTELLRTDEERPQPEEFRRLLRDSEAAARQLESELRAWASAADAKPNPPAVLGHLAKRISANCVSCHQTFRDMPLDDR